MSAFNGKWKRVSATNVDEFIKAVGLEGDKAAKVRRFIKECDIVEEFTVTEHGSRRKIYVDDQLYQEVDSTFNQAEETMTVLGKTKLLPKKVSDTRLEYTETVPGRGDAISVLTVDGNNLILDYTYQGVTCRRVYEKQ